MVRSTGDRPTWKIIEETWKENNGDLRIIFRRLNWGAPEVAPFDIEINGVNNVPVTPVSSLRSFHAFEIPLSTNTPNSFIRQVQKEIAKTYPDYVLIVKDADFVRFEWPRRKPDGGIRFDTFITGVIEPSQLACQKLAGVSFGVVESGSASLETVRSRVYGLASEDVTKKFYDRFRKEHKNIADAISTDSEITDPERQSYSSLLLNRLMFVYFLQKKEFLNNDPNLLRNTLRKCEESSLNFYRDALLPLFFEGFNGQNQRFSTQLLNELWGSIPYINGGIFAPNTLETYTELKIPNNAFTELFEFFESFSWHLDARPLGSSNEINPEVLGYIFEQYINETADGKKEGGAYYTPEDVTGYMVAQTLVPRVLDEFEKIWPKCLETIKQNPSDYLHQSLFHGAESQVPLQWLEIPAEMSTIWLGDPISWDRLDNAELSPELCLPGETWLEMFVRRERAEQILAEIAASSVNAVNQLIFYNLNGSKLISDIISGCTDNEELLRAWRAVSEISVIDPTCGSGAFLFAALTTLENIYEEILDALGENAFLVGNEFATGNVRYQVRKHVAMQNLYGTDIMPDAIETAKLRVFLALAAVVERASDIEPLPDLDFNLKTGNLLVGLYGFEDINRINPGDFLELFDFYDLERLSTEYTNTFHEFKLAERQKSQRTPEIKVKLNALETNLRQLANQKYIEIAGFTKDEGENWISTNLPFHWMTEFPQVMVGGGFDVVIGNPPYVTNTSKMKKDLAGYETQNLPDIYAACFERAVQITKNGSRTAFIVPISSQFGRDFEVLRGLLNRTQQEIFISTYDRRPSAIFTGKVGVRNSIWISQKRGNTSGEAKVSVSPTYRWRSEFRTFLFNSIRYVEKDCFYSEGWERTFSKKLDDVFLKLFARGGNLGRSTRNFGERLYFKGNALYYLQFFAEPPPLILPDGTFGTHSMMSSIAFKTEHERDAALAISLSKLMYLWWLNTSDNLNVTKQTVESFPISLETLSEESMNTLQNLGKTIRMELPLNIEFTFYRDRKVGRYVIPNLSPLLTQVDAVLASEFDFEPEVRAVELAFRSARKGEEVGD